MLQLTRVSVWTSRKSETLGNCARVIMQTKLDWTAIGCLQCRWVAFSDDVTLRYLEKKCTNFWVIGECNHGLRRVALKQCDWFNAKHLSDAAMRRACNWQYQSYTWLDHITSKTLYLRSTRLINSDLSWRIAGAVPANRAVTNKQSNEFTYYTEERSKKWCWNFYGICRLD